METLRFDDVYSKACEFILFCGVNSLPVCPMELIVRNHWGLMTYGELCRVVPGGATVDDIAAACKSSDGFTVQNGNGSNFCIAYNETVRVKSRIAFTLMHEIGHIVCGHFNGKTPDPKCYREYEAQANYFASNVLAPAAVIDACGLRTPQLLQASCGISYNAAKARLSQIDGWSPRAIDSEILKTFRTYIQISTRRRSSNTDICCAI